MCWQHIIQGKNVNTTYKPEHTNIFGIEEVLKTDNLENGSNNTKDDCENSKEKTERYFKYRQRNLWINVEQLVTVTKTLFWLLTFSKLNFFEINEPNAYETLSSTLL